MIRRETTVDERVETPQVVAPVSAPLTVENVQEGKVDTVQSEARYLVRQSVYNYSKKQETPLCTGLPRPSEAAPHHLLEVSGVHQRYWRGLPPQCQPAAGHRRLLLAF